MFNLGYKQVVINDGALITKPATPGNQVHIEGFGVFTVGASVDVGMDDHFGPFEPYVVGNTLCTAPAGWAAGDIYTVRLYYSGTRVLSDMWTRGDTLQFQTYSGGTNSGSFFGELADGMNAALEDYVVTFDKSTGKFTFRTEYAGITITRITAKKLDPVIDDRFIPEEDITGAIVEGDEGTGTARQVEASIRMATEWTQEPYKIQTGGNESVDPHGEYNEYVWNTRADAEANVAGNAWTSHELSGFGKSNAGSEGEYMTRRYVVYLNKKGSGFAAADTLLKTLIVTN